MRAALHFTRWIIVVPGVARVARRLPPQGLFPVDLISTPSVSGGLRVELANGRRILVEAGFDASVLKQLVAVLEG